MKRRLLIVLYIVNVIFSLLPVNHISAENSITYIDRFLGPEGKVLEKETVLTDYEIYNGQTELKDNKWYVIDSNRTVEDRVNINGNVGLVVVDGVEINFKKGLHVGPGKKLSIFGQSDDSGILYARAGWYDAAIGSNDKDDDGHDASAGSIFICGGTIDAYGGHDAAGIGGGNEADGGEIVIYGGKVKAHGGINGAGIGGGDEGNGGTIEIYGGTIDARGNDGGAGIGGGDEGNGGTITIFYGTVTAKGHSWGAGIGGGDHGQSGNITIKNGTVDAQCDGHPYRGAGIGSGASVDQGGTITIEGGLVHAYARRGAGIGGGYEGNGGKIIIKDGLVNAASEYGAGIGGGSSNELGHGGDGGEINIQGGMVIAASTKKGAGIGGGDDGDGGIVNISGGHVTATGGYFDYDYWDSNVKPEWTLFIKTFPEGANPYSAIGNFIIDLIFSGEYGGAGIGGGDDGEGGTVNITHGTVVAFAGIETASAIGHGNDEDESGTLKVYSEAKVTCGNITDKDVDVDELPVLANQRERKPSQRTFAMIEKCDHPDGKFESVGEEGHYFECDRCSSSYHFEDHKFLLGGTKCVQCGYEFVTVEFEANGGSGKMDAVRTEKGKAYTLPDSAFTAPEGKTFAGWKGSINGGSQAVYPAGSSHVLTEDLKLTAQWADPYKLWVGGVAVTSANKDDILGDGKVSYNPDTCTLNFNNVTSFDNVYNSTLIYSDGIDLTITGKANLTRLSGNFFDGINIRSGSLTIDGDFTVLGAIGNAINVERYLIIKSGDIKVQAGSFGIRCERKIFIKDTITRLEANGGAKAIRYNTYYDKGIEIDPGIVIKEYRRLNSSGLPLSADPPIDQAVHIVLAPGLRANFHLNGGEMEGQTGVVSHVYNDNTVDRPDNNPLRRGYDFAGWFGNEELTEQFDFEHEYDDNQTVEIYAKWKKDWSVHKTWQVGEQEAKPDLRVVLQKNQNGTWTIVETKTLSDINEWSNTIRIYTGETEINAENYRILERDKNDNPVEENDDHETSIILEVDGGGRGYLLNYEVEEGVHTEITNSSVIKYSAELSWDIDFDQHDRPDSIEAALQRKESRFSWTTVEAVELNPANHWSKDFEPVPVGHVDNDGKFVKYEYRIRELRPLKEDEPQPQTEEERQQSYKDRTIHDYFDFDKPFIKNLLEIADPQNVWTVDATLDWLELQAEKVVFPLPTFVTHIAAYDEETYNNIHEDEHDTKYYVGYKFNKNSNKMYINDIAMIDASIYKRWFFFEDDEMPEYVYIMLMSKIQNDYAEAAGLEEYNIYTPVASCIPYTPQLNIADIPGIDTGELIKEGIEKFFGDGLASDVLDKAVTKILETYTQTGIALVEVRESGGWNPIAHWHTYFGVKKYGYGDMRIKMDFAGAELVTGLMEMVLDALLRAAGIPKISIPIMYDPFHECWSIKGFAFNIPALDKDYELTGNVINFKVDWDGSDGNVISGTKHWIDNGENRPESIKIHLFAEWDDKEGSHKKEELSVSPITVTGTGDDWAWSQEIPLNEIVICDEDNDDLKEKIKYKDITIEEDVPEGYTASYDGYDITNKKDSIPTINITGSKTWDDNNDEQGARPSSITIKLLADGEEVRSKTVTASDNWSWTFSDLPKYKKDGSTEIRYEIKESPISDYSTEYHDDYDVTNTYDPSPKPTKKLTIIVNGNTDTVTYNGQEQSVRDYTLSCDDRSFDEGKVIFNGEAVAKGTDPGTYQMDLDSSKFSYSDQDVDATFLVIDGWLVIKPKVDPTKEIVITVSGNNDTVEYNGKQQSVTGYTLQCDSELFDRKKVIFTGEAKASGTEVGTYQMNLKSSQFSYDDPKVTATFLVTDGWLMIIPKSTKEIVITVNGNTDTVTYDGNKHEVTDYTLSCDDPSFNRNKVVFSGEAKASGTDVDTYPMNLGKDQFIYVDPDVTARFEVTDGWLKIEPASITIKVNGNTDSKVYNGEKQSFEGTFTASSDDPNFDASKFTYEGDTTASGTDVGDYTRDPKEGSCKYDDNYTVNWVLEDPVKLTITPKELPITVNGNTKTVDYNGQEQSVEGYELQCDDPLFKESNVSFTGKAEAKGTEPDTYPMNLQTSQFGYNDKNVRATFTVNDGWLIIQQTTKEITVKVKGNTSTVTYNGKEQSVTGFELECEDEDFDKSKVVFRGSDQAKGTNVDTYSMGLNKDQFNYLDPAVKATFVVTDGWLKIEPANITITIEGDRKEFTYDGKEHSAEGYTASSDSEFFNEEKIVFTGTAKVTETEVGEYPMGLQTSQFSYDDPNIDEATFVITDGKLVIKQPTKKITIQVTGNTKTVTYNGEEQSVTGYELKCDDKPYDESKVSFTGKAEVKGTNVDTYPMGLKDNQFSYNDLSVDATFVVTDGWLKIEPADITITIKGDRKEFTYDGEEHSAEGYTASSDSKFFNKDKVTYDGEAKVTKTDVGTYPMGLQTSKFSYNDQNLNATFEVTDGQLKINPVPEPEELVIKVIGNNDTKTYNGEEQSVTGYKLECDDPSFDKDKVKFTGDDTAKGTDVGIYQMGLKESDYSYDDEKTKARFLIVDGWLTIVPEPREIVIGVIGNTDTVTYNGKQQSVSGYTFQCGDPTFDENKVKFSGKAVAKGTAVGTYNMNLNVKDFSYDDDNVKATFLIVDGWLKIEPVPEPGKLTITVIGNTGAKVYNGEEQFVEGYELHCGDPSFKKDKVIFSGEAKAKGTEVGVYKMGLDVNDFSYDVPGVEATFVVIDGWLMIAPVPDPKLVIQVIGNTDTKTYNGEEQSVTGYSLLCDDPLYDSSKVKFTGEAKASGTEVGSYPMGLESAQFSYEVADITATFLVADGWLLITPKPRELVITVSGNTDTKTYNGEEQAVTGYTLQCADPAFDEKKVIFTGEAIAKGTDIDTYPMNLSGSQFAYDDPDITATFVIEDGWLKIIPRTFKITYKLNGGTYDGKGDDIVETYPENTVISIHEAPVRDGYTFIYWLGSVYYPGDSYTVTEDHTFIAVWKKDGPDPIPPYIPPRTGD